MQSIREEFHYSFKLQLLEGTPDQLLHRFRC